LERVYNHYYFIIRGVIHKRVETLVSTLLCARRAGKNRSPIRRKTPAR